MHDIGACRTASEKIGTEWPGGLMWGEILINAVAFQFYFSTRSRSAVHNPLPFPSPLSRKTAHRRTQRMESAQGGLRAEGLERVKVVSRPRGQRGCPQGGGRQRPSSRAALASCLCITRSHVMARDLWPAWATAAHQPREAHTLDLQKRRAQTGRNRRQIPPKHTNAKKNMGATNGGHCCDINMVANSSEKLQTK